MKAMRFSWLLGLAVVLASAPAGNAVPNDVQPPCWRGQASATRLLWRFDTGASPIAPEVSTHPLGARAQISPNANAVGWLDNSCVVYGFGCDPWNGDPDPFGTAQGYWDLGGTNQLAPQPGFLILTLTNTPVAGATRYLWVQATVWIESGFFGYPSYVVSNATLVAGPTNLLVETPTNWDGSFHAGGWYNQRTLWSVPATGAVDQIRFNAAGVGTIVDAVGVDVLVRQPAGGDALNARKNVATNWSGALFLANDGGPSLSVVGVSSPSSAGGLVSWDGSQVHYTPPSGYTGPDSFYYTNSDCAGIQQVGLVSVTVLPPAPLANLDVFTRTQGLGLKIPIAALLTNDVGEGLEFAGLELVSTNGLTVTTNSTTIFYPAATNQVDRLTYYVRDAHEQTASGYVLIQAVAPPAQSLTVVRLEVGVPGPGTNTLTLAGIPGYEYVVEVTTNVGSGPWWGFATNP
ncbi:MAG: Ig-like domain-containing protein, partial [Verrucomicrobiae bacterium]|nr:Ig-like domain-containing protein [Verrucomicrobiae bacterium]